MTGCFKAGVQERVMAIIASERGAVSGGVGALFKMRCMVWGHIGSLAEVGLKGVVLSSCDDERRGEAMGLWSAIGLERP